MSNYIFGHCLLVCCTMSWEKILRDNVKLHWAFRVSLVITLIYINVIRMWMHQKGVPSPILILYNVSNPTIYLLFHWTQFTREYFLWQFISICIFLTQPPIIEQNPILYETLVCMCSHARLDAICKEKCRAWHKHNMYKRAWWNNDRMIC